MRTHKPTHFGHSFLSETDIHVLKPQPSAHADRMSAGVCRGFPLSPGRGALGADNMSNGEAALAVSADRCRIRWKPPGIQRKGTSRPLSVGTVAARINF